MSKYFGNGYTEVWADNLDEQLQNIPKYHPVIAVSTKFPGNPDGNKKCHAKGRTQRAYSVIKRDVDPTKLITLGL